MRADVAGADPDADRPRRRRRPRHGPGDRRRRLPAEAVRAARAAAAPRATSSSATHAAAPAPARRRSRPLRPVHLPLRPRASCGRATRSIRITEREREILTHPRQPRRRQRAARGARRRRRSPPNERTVDVQINRLRRKIEADPANPVLSADRARHRLSAVGRLMRSAMRASPPEHGRPLSTASRAGSAGMLPKGLYARSLIIIIAPMILLQSVVAYVFMERHWQTVTRRLSAAVTADIAALIDIYESYPQDKECRDARRASRSDRLQLDVDILPTGPCRRPGRSRSSRSSTDALARDRAARSAGRSGSTRSGAPTSSRSASSSTTSVHARPRPPQPGLCLELAHLPGVDGRHLARAARRSRSCSCATRSGRSCGLPRRPKLRQGARDRVPPARRARGAPGRPRLHRDEAAHRARTSSSARRCSTASATTCAPSSPASSSRSRCSTQTPEVEELKQDVDEMSRMLEGYLAFARGDAGEQAVADRPAAAARGAAEPTPSAHGHATEVDISRRSRWSRCGPTPSGAARQPRRQRRAPRRPHRHHRRSRDRAG